MCIRDSCKTATRREPAERGDNLSVVMLFSFLGVSESAFEVASGNLGCLRSTDALQAQIAEAGVIIGPPSQRPAELAVFFGNGAFVDARKTARHITVVVEFPVLVAIGPEPIAAVIVVFIGIAHGDAVALKRPKFLDQAVV